MKLHYIKFFIVMFLAISCSKEEPVLKTSPTIEMNSDRAYFNIDGGNDTLVCTGHNLICTQLDDYVGGGTIVIYDRSLKKSLIDFTAGESLIIGNFTITCLVSTAQEAEYKISCDKNTSYSHCGISFCDDNGNAEAEIFQFPEDFLWDWTNWF